MLCSVFISSCGKSFLNGYLHKPYELVKVLFELICITECFFVERLPCLLEMLMWMLFIFCGFSLNSSSCGWKGKDLYLKGKAIFEQVAVMVPYLDSLTPAQFCSEVKFKSWVVTLTQVCWLTWGKLSDVECNIYCGMKYLLCTVEWTGSHLNILLELLFICLACILLQKEKRLNKSLKLS